MRAWQQVRQAAVWVCLGLVPNCPYFDTRSNAFPLHFGMTPEDAATALNAPLSHVSGGRGSELFYTELPSGVPGLAFGYDRQLWLQFRNGRLAGWKNDWRRAGAW